MVMSKLLIELLPSSFVTKLRQRSDLFRIATNTGWLVTDKFISIVVGLLVGAWVAVIWDLPSMECSIMLQPLWRCLPHSLDWD